jgi:hypothetical protein
LFHALPAHPPFSLAKHFNRPWCHLKTSRRMLKPPRPLHLTCQTIYALCITRTWSLCKYKRTLLEFFRTPLLSTGIRYSFLKSVGFFLSDNVLRGLHPSFSEPVVLWPSQNTFRPLNLVPFLRVHEQHQASDWFMIMLPYLQLHNKHRNRESPTLHYIFSVDPCTAQLLVVVKSIQ